MWDIQGFTKFIKIGKDGLEFIFIVMIEKTTGITFTLK